MQATSFVDVLGTDRELSCANSIASPENFHLENAIDLKQAADFDIIAYLFQMPLETLRLGYNLRYVFRKF